jgi:hypothetical protein
MLIAHLSSLGPSGISLRIPWELRRQDVAPKTVDGYTRDLVGFAR